MPKYLRKYSQNFSEVTRLTAITEKTYTMHQHLIHWWTQNCLIAFFPCCFLSSVFVVLQKFLLFIIILFNNH